MEDDAAPLRPKTSMECTGGLISVESTSPRHGAPAAPAGEIFAPRLVTAAAHARGPTPLSLHPPRPSVDQRGLFLPSPCVTVQRRAVRTRLPDRTKLLESVRSTRTGQRLHPTLSGRSVPVVGCRTGPTYDADGNALLARDVRRGPRQLHAAGRQVRPLAGRRREHHGPSPTSYTRQSPDASAGLRVDG